MGCTRRALLGGVALGAAELAASQRRGRAQGSARPLRIGVLNDMSSLYSGSTGKGSFYAAQMAAADFGGTVLGLPIEILAGDHQNKPDVGASVARHWYDVDGVDMITDVPNSAVALAVQQLTREKNRVVLFSGAGTSDLTGSECSPNGIHWAMDTYTISHSTVAALAGRGEKDWFFVTADYAFGHALERDATRALRAEGGTVVGSVRAPFPTSDFSSFLLQAQASKAKVLAFAEAGGDLVNAVKQANEFGLGKSGMTISPLMANLDVVHGIGPAVGQGMIFSDAFYWDRTDATRAFAQRFLAHEHQMPGAYHAGVYSATLSYLKAVQRAGTRDAGPVLAALRSMRFSDMFVSEGWVRADGHLMHDMYLVRIKSPAQQTGGEWDLLEILATIPKEQVVMPLSDTGCTFAGAH